MNKESSWACPEERQGRTDFPGSDYKVLFDSIKKLVELPADTVVYPGHGPITTIRDFKRYFG